MSKMVVQQPQPVMVVNTSNQWSSGICDFCEDVPECCFSFWCFPCFACATSRKHGECLCLPLLDSFGCIPPITVAMRASLRQRYGIEGSICNDCICTYFCYPCVWCQMSREMNVRNQAVTLLTNRTK
ncbi:cornifelin homolog B-like [Trichomycterus rosablanca]|uniref:cornifelin homolog B-like n=1 Tax=Trichomycterus rosablanca TaxID=2290929 RepID=UPI002F360C96